MFKKIAIIIFFIYLIPLCTQASPGGLLINEIAWMGTENSSTDEWIELYNPSSEDILLDGWLLKANDGQPEIHLSGTILSGGYYLLERTDDEVIPEIKANLLYVGSLSNSGENLELFDSGGNLVDSIDNSMGWEFGDNDTKQTMQRVDINTWQSSISPAGSPGMINNIETSNDVPEEIVENPVVNNILGTFVFQYGDILINEFVSDPTDGEVEWIEIFNTTNKKIDLDAWYIKEGSGSKTLLKGIINEHGYFIIEKPGGNLNNKGDEILLFSPNAKLVNDITYGDWDDGDVSDNAPVAGDPLSTARVTNKDTRNNFNDFALTLKPTKGSANIILSEDEFVPDDIDDYDFGQTLIVSEILPNPIGNDDENEFIELYNYGDRDISLFGWRLGDASKKRFEFGRGDTIRAKSYLVLYRGDTKIALNNSGDDLKIYQAGADEAFYSLSYKKGEEGYSFNNTRVEDIDNFYNKDFDENYWIWSEDLSPGQKNKFKLINHPPEVDFSFSDNLFVGVPVLFDSSDSFDEDDDELKYHWDFGDGFQNILTNPEHTFFQEGNFNVVLEVNDGENISLSEKVLKIENNFSVSPVKKLEKEEIDKGDIKIYISEILPNPDGDDVEGEFIEIHNASEFPVNLADWILDDMEGGSKPYKFGGDNIVDAGGFYVLNRTDSGVILNNTYDKVRLMDANENIIDSVEYQKTSNAKSYDRDEFGNWYWTEDLTPGSVNDFPISGSDLGVDRGFSNSEGEYYSQKPPREIQLHDAGQFVLTEGVVNSLPGMCSSQYFYIEGDGGVQIYSYSKDFPDLKIGDLVNVRGEISKINLESRVKTKDRNDITVIDAGYTIEPIKIDEELNEAYLGRLVFLEGRVLEKNSNKFTLENSNGQYNFEIKSNVEIDPKRINTGNSLSAVGVVSSNKNGYIVLPRFDSDIEILEDLKPTEEGRVLGEHSTQEEWSLEQKDRKYYYLIVYFFALLVLIFIYKKTRV